MVATALILPVSSCDFGQTIHEHCGLQVAALKEQTFGGIGFFPVLKRWVLHF